MTLLLLMMMGSVARSGVKVKRAEILGGWSLRDKDILVYFAYLNNNLWRESWFGK